MEKLRDTIFLLQFLAEVKAVSEHKADGPLKGIFREESRPKAWVLYVTRLRNGCRWDRYGLHFIVGLAFFVTTWIYVDFFNLSK